MLDLLIRNGTVYDGVREEGRITSIGIMGDRIVSTELPEDTPAARTIDATGKTVIPGMIDVHAHTDMWSINHPDCIEAISQGITTQIIGPCGIGVFPLLPRDVDYLKSVEAIIGENARCYSGCAEYLNAIPDTTVNIAAQVSHSALRMAVAGHQDRKLTADEQARMEELTEEAFAEGACGLTTGLAYYPAAFGDTREFIGLCKVAARYDAPVCIHQRTALREPDPAFDPKEEVLDFARGSGAHLQYSHYRTGLKNAGKVRELLEPILRGRAEGLNITADFYPYPIGAGYSAVVLPMWAMDGGLRHTLERLSDPEIRKKIVAEISGAPSMLRGVVTHAPLHPEYVGRTYEEIAELRHQHVADMLVELLLEEKLNVGYQLERNFPEPVLAQLDRDFCQLIREPYYMMGTDMLPGQMLVHPRTYGAFTRMLRLVIQNKVGIGLFANRVSYQPAEWFGLRDRGSVREGCYADLCILDERTLSDQATIDDPARLSTGIEQVIVNGACVYAAGRLTGVRSGRALRRA